MKELTNYKRVAGYLDKIFNLANEAFFENALSKPIITIQSTPKAYGHVSVNKIWNGKNEDGQHELNIGAGTLNRPIEDVVATLIHEMIHLYCIANGIKDTSRGNTYHNKKFKAEAEKRGLIIEHDERIGYSITSAGDDVIQFCIDKDLVDIKINRIEFYGGVGIGGAGGKSPTAGGGTPKPSNTRKYQCPCCKNSVRATKDVNIICGDCNEPMLRV